MKNNTKRIALNFGRGYIPGLSSVIKGVTLAAHELGWEAAGIRDGFDGLLFPERYPEGGLVNFTSGMAMHPDDISGSILGTAAQADPFRVRVVNDQNQVEEVDRSDELLEKIRAEKIDAVISVVSARALGIPWKLHRKGMKTICIPSSVENDIATTMLSFGFNSALSFVSDMLDRAYLAAQSARRIGVVEVLGENSGWLALQAGMAVCADAVLTPEIPYDLEKVAMELREKMRNGRPFGLVVVAEGSVPRGGEQLPEGSTLPDSLKGTLSPGAGNYDGPHTIERSGIAAETVALRLQRLTDQPTYPIVLTQLARGGNPTVVDQQLGLGYGVGAVRAIKNNLSGVMVVFQPPDLKYVSLTEAMNKVRIVPADSEFVQIARDLGISLGD